MKKYPHLFLFLISMGGGLIWGVLMFLLMEIDGEYDRQSARIWLGGGVVFGLLFYLGMEAIFFVSAWNERRKRKALEGLREELQPYELSYFGTINYRKNETCPALICFHPNRFHVAFVRGRHISVLEIYYCDINTAFFSGSYFHFEQGESHMWMGLEISSEEAEELRKFLVDFGLNKEACFDTSGRLFFGESERTGKLHAQFFFCRKDGSGAFSVESEGVISVHMMDVDRFLSEYKDCFLSDERGSAAHDGPTYSKNQTEQILSAVKQRRPVGCEDLIPWLERAVAEYDGISFGGF